MEKDLIMKPVSSVYACVLFLALATSAHAAPIRTLFNSGVLDDGSLAPAGSIDLHYGATFHSSDPEDDTLPLISPVKVPSFFPDTWVQNTATSRWLWAVPPFSDPNYTEPGSYHYVMQFDLTGYDPSSSVITGRWASNDLGLDMVVNGHSTGQTANPFTFTDFVIDPKTLVSGMNVLDLPVRVEGPNPDGIQVQFTQATANTVPEPSSMFMLGAGLAWLIVRRFSSTRRAGSQNGA
jgi:hypothetical protein